MILPHGGVPEIKFTMVKLWKMEKKCWCSIVLPTKSGFYLQKKWVLPTKLPFSIGKKVGLPTKKRWFSTARHWCCAVHRDAKEAPAMQEPRKCTLWQAGSWGFLLGKSGAFMVISWEFYGDFSFPLGFYGDLIGNLWWLMGSSPRKERWKRTNCFFSWQKWRNIGCNNNRCGDMILSQTRG